MEKKRKTVAMKLIWTAGMKYSNSQNRDKHNIFCTNHLVEFHSKYISNQKYCCNQLNQERHGSKGFFVFSRLFFFKIKLQTTFGV